MGATLTEAAFVGKDLGDLRWFAGLVRDLLYFPGQTQKSLDDSLEFIRDQYRARNRDGTFLEMFTRVRTVFPQAGNFAELGLALTFPYTREDFLYTDAPYKEIAAESNSFRQRQLIERLDARARAVGVKKFQSLWKQYDHASRKEQDGERAFLVPVEDGEMQLDSAGWHMDASGIWREAGTGTEYACTHPIAPVGRLVNLDTGEERLIIMFERAGTQRRVIRSKRDLFDSARVLDLAAVGVAVTSQSAKALSRYLCEMEDANYEELPQRDSVGRLGWLDDGGFSPFIKDVEFDGDAAYGRIFAAIKSHGSFEAWRVHANGCRAYSLTAKIMLAASFASVLIKKIGGLPFFVHLWGVDSETGKTVALMLAASVWGNPEIGQYVQTFRSTQVGHEKVAAFLKNIPMCIDEKQLDSRFDVYQLAEGVGKTRGNKAGGIDRTPTWSLAILTTGETPLTGAGVGAGAVNRVIDIECRSPDKVIENGRETARTVMQHYGHAGRRFVEALTPARVGKAVKLYDDYFHTLARGDTTEKQAGAAALILTADRLADEIIFQSGAPLTAEEIAGFLQSKATVSAGRRGYAYLCDWVAANVSHFEQETPNGEVYGILDGDYAYINRTIYRRAVTEGGFDERALLSWLKANGLILTRGRNNTRGRRIRGVNVECVVLQMPKADDCGTF